MKPLKDVRVKKIDLAPPRRGIRIIVVLLVIFVAWVVAMSIIANYVQPTKISSTHTSDGGLYYELAIDKTRYRSGEPIRLRLVVKNVSQKVVALKFSTTQMYNFAVKHDINFIFFHFPIDVWQSAYHMIPHPISSTLVLKPQEKKVFEDTWNQKDAKGQQVPEGRYLIFASLTNTGAKTVLQLPARMQR